MRVPRLLASLAILGLLAAPTWAGGGRGKSPASTSSAAAGKPAAARGARTAPGSSVPRGSRAAAGASAASVGTLPGINPGTGAYISRGGSHAPNPGRTQPAAPRAIDPKEHIATETNFKKPQKPAATGSGGQAKPPKRPSLSGPDDKWKTFKPKDRSKVNQKSNSTILPPR